MIEKSTNKIKIQIRLQKSTKYRSSRPEAGTACNVIKKETLAQVFSCEFCEISKNTFFTEHVWATAFELLYFHVELNDLC